MDNYCRSLAKTEDAESRASSRSISQSFKNNLVKSLEQINTLQISFISYTLGDLVSIAFQNYQTVKDTHLNDDQKFAPLVFNLSRKLGTLLFYWPLIFLFKRPVAKLVRIYLGEQTRFTRASDALETILTTVIFGIPINDVLKTYVVTWMASRMLRNPSVLPEFFWNIFGFTIEPYSLKPHYVGWNLFGNISNVPRI